MKTNKNGIPIVSRSEFKLIHDRMLLKKINKGIVLIGQPGIGKTTIVRDLLKNTATNARENIIKSNPGISEYRLSLKLDAFMPDTRLVPSNDLVLHYMEKGKIVTVKHIDDLGTEPIANHYGTNLDVVPFIIQDLYSKNKDFGYYTTNLNYNELIDRYGLRVVERLQEKCYFFILEDTSFRKITTPEQLNEDLK